MWEEGITTKPQNYLQSNYTSIPQVNKQKGARNMKTVEVEKTKKKHINKRIYMYIHKKTYTVIIIKKYIYA